MTALIVIGAIALVLFILLASSIRVDAEYDEVFKYRVKYLFFTFIKNPLSPRELKKKKKKELKKKKKLEKEQRKKGAHLKEKTDIKTQDAEETGQAVQTETEQKETDKKEQPQDKTKEATPKKPKMKFSFDLIRRIIGRASPHIKRIFKKIRLSNVAIDITVGGDDAAKVAIGYGVHCSFVHSLVALLDHVISFKADKISVKADFELPKSDYRLKGTLKLRVSTLLHSGIWGFFAVLSEIRKGSVAAEQAKTEEKKAA
ncbi:MAG: DUF2953 domain-containing protein [Oscillospiraceae bacterium]|nr:DUF2953 domain-containing protein [Oscillospiraceae bacterium]